jgi:uncharacterized membrane protein
MRISYLFKGFPGHPAHPPMTDAAIGAYTAATILVCVGAAGIAEEALAKGWWLTLIVGLGFAVLAVVTGLLDWLMITWWTPLWRTATLHMLVMLTSAVFFGLAAILGHSGYAGSAIDTAPLVLTLVGFAFLTLGGWLGGSIVFVYGMRTLNLMDEPAKRAISPLRREKERKEAA